MVIFIQRHAALPPGRLGSPVPRRSAGSQNAPPSQLLQFDGSSWREAAVAEADSENTTTIRGGAIPRAPCLVQSLQHLQVTRLRSERRRVCTPRAAGFVSGRRHIPVAVLRRLVNGGADGRAEPRPHQRDASRRGCSDRAELRRHRHLVPVLHQRRQHPKG